MGQWGKIFMMRISNALSGKWVSCLKTGKYSAYQSSKQLICSKFENGVSLQLENILLHIAPFCLQVQYFCVEPFRQPHFTVFMRSGGAISLDMSIDTIHLFVIFHLQSKIFKFADKQHLKLDLVPHLLL